MNRSNIGALILLAAIIGYGAIKAFPLISGPQIEIYALGTDEQGLTILSGRALYTQTLTINGGILLIDDTGAFQKRVALPRGGGILTLTATDRFGRSQTMARATVTP